MEQEKDTIDSANRLLSLVPSPTTHLVVCVNWLRVLVPNNTKFPICYERKPRAVVVRFAPSSPLESIDDGDACPFTVHNIDDLFEDDKVSQGGPGTCEASPTITSHHQCPAVPATILLLLTKWSTL